MAIEATPVSHSERYTAHGEYVVRLHVAQALERRLIEVTEKYAKTISILTEGMNKGSITVEPSYAAALIALLKN